MPAISSCIRSTAGSRLVPADIAFAIAQRSSGAPQPEAIFDADPTPHTQPGLHTRPALCEVGTRWVELSGRAETGAESPRRRPEVGQVLPDPTHHAQILVAQRILAQLLLDED